MRLPEDPAAARRTVDDANERAYSLRLADPRAALRLAGSARSLAARAGHPAGEAAALRVSGACRCLLHEHAAARADLDAAVEIASRIHHPLERGRALTWIGFVELQRGEHVAALAAETAALEIQRAIADEDGEAATLNHVGSIFLALDDYSTALEAYTASWRIVGAKADFAGISHCLHNIGAVRHYLGQYGKAGRCFRLALKFKRKAGDRVNYANTLLNLANNEEKLNRHDRAIHYFWRAESAARRWGRVYVRAVARQQIGWVEIRTGHVERGLASHRAALDVIRGADAPFWECECLLEHGRALMSIGRFAEAVAPLEESLAVAGRIGAPRFLAQAHQELAAVNEALGDHEAARAHLQVHREVQGRRDESLRRSRAAVARATRLVTEAQIRRLEDAPGGRPRPLRRSRRLHDA